jgi:hypothetical protein
MRFKFIVSLIALPLLGGCLGPEYLVTHTPNDPSVREETASLRESQPHYTRHPAAAVKPEIVRLAIDEGFDTYDRARILRAVNEWNHVLNGYVRLDMDPARDMELSTAVWVVAPQRGGRLAPAPAGTFSNHALAVTQPLWSTGGMVIVHVDRVGARDLAGVMRHELGHVLGLGHDANGRLMSARYSTHHQRCIDRSAAEAIAGTRKLPATALNWCEESQVASADDAAMPAAHRATR